MSSAKTNARHYTQGRKTKCRTGARGLGGSRAEGDLGLLVGHGLSRSQGCDAVAKMQSGAVLECKAWAVRVPLSAVLLGRLLEYGVQLWTSGLKKDVEKLRRIQR